MVVGHVGTVFANESGGGSDGFRSRLLVAMEMRRLDISLHKKWQLLLAECSEEK